MHSSARYTADTIDVTSAPRPETPRVIVLESDSGGGSPVDAAQEALLWQRLHEDPNDVEAFPRLAEIVRRRAGEGHVGGDQQRAADDAVWALAEELAHNGKAWYPLIELARLSVHDDRDAALRRLATASDRDPSGRALATGLAMLRETQMPSDALGLGVAHWRPREHDLEAGRHLAALSLHPDSGRVAALRAELEGLLARLEAERAAGGPMTDPAGIAVTGPLIDLRDAAAQLAAPDVGGRTWHRCHHAVQVVDRFGELRPVHRLPRVGAEHRLRGQPVVDRIHRFGHLGPGRRIGVERSLGAVRRKLRLAHVGRELRVDHVGRQS